MEASLKEKHTSNQARQIIVYHYLLTEFSKILGFSSFPKDMFSITVNNQLDINLGHLEASEEIIFVAYIANLPADNKKSATILKELLISNYGGESCCNSSLGLCPEGKSIVFSVRAKLRGLHLPELLQTFEHIISVGQKWYDHIQQNQHKLPETEERKIQLNSATKFRADTALKA